jgi:hypothetical protein
MKALNQLISAVRDISNVLLNCIQNRINIIMVTMLRKDPTHCSNLLTIVPFSIKMLNSFETKTKENGEEGNIRTSILSHPRKIQQFSICQSVYYLSDCLLSMDLLPLYCIYILFYILFYILVVQM